MFLEQLEEFERAVRESHRRRPLDKSAVTRHNQFILAMEDQISQVEKALGQSLVEEGKEPLQWVQLDEEERNDLALFLSAPPPAGDRTAPSTATSFREVISFNTDSKFLVEVEAKEKTSSKRRDETPDQGNLNSGQRRACSSPDIGAWRIVIADEESKERKPPETRAESPSPAGAHGSLKLMKVVELVARVKWLRKSFGKAKNADGRPIEQGTSGCLDFKGITRVSQVRIRCMSTTHRAMAAPLICFSAEFIDYPEQRLKAMGERGGGCLSDCREGVISHLAEAQRHEPGHYMQLKRPSRVTVLLALAMLLLGEFIFRGLTS